MGTSTHPLMDPEVQKMLVKYTAALEHAKSLVELISHAKTTFIQCHGVKCSNEQESLMFAFTDVEKLEPLLNELFERYAEDL